MAINKQLEAKKKKIPCSFYFSFFHFCWTFCGGGGGGDSRLPDDLRPEVNNLRSHVHFCTITSERIK